MFDEFFKARMLGTPFFPRYVIRDDTRKGYRRGNNWFWTGAGWTRNLRKALLFADPRELARNILDLTKGYLEKRYPERTMHFEVTVSFYGPESVTQEEIGAYLGKALQLSLDYKQYGMGPTPESAVFVEVPRIEEPAPERTD